MSQQSEGTTTNFLKEIKSFSVEVKKNTVISGAPIEIVYDTYDDKDILRTVLEWRSCLNMMGQKNAFQEKEFMKIIYTLLSDVRVNKHIILKKQDEDGSVTEYTINKIDFYDPHLNKLINFEIITKDKKTVRIKPFIVCDKIIIIDCRKLSKCSIYELSGLEEVYKLYEVQKMNFDRIKKDFGLKSLLTFNLNHIEDHFKDLSFNNLNYHVEQHLRMIRKHMKTQQELEDEIMNEWSLMMSKIKAHLDKKK